jgi:hypothetical protein
MGPRGMARRGRRRGRRRGLIVGAAVGSAVSRRNDNNNEAQDYDASPAGNDLLTDLDELARLRDDGALTDEEFKMQKEKLLGD